MGWSGIIHRVESGLSAISDLILIMQPVLGGLVYLSILAGYPPLWLSWLIFVAPFLLRWWHWGIVVKRTSFDIPIIILVAGLLVGLAVSSDKAISLEALQTYLVCILMYYSGVTNAMRISWYWKLVVVITLTAFMVLAVLTFAQTRPGLRVVPFNQWLYQAGALTPLNIDYYLNPNALGTVMGISAPGFLAFFLFSKQRGRRVMAVSLAALCITLLLLSTSISGLVATFVGAGFLLLLWKPWVLFLYLPGGICAILVAIWRFYPITDSLWSKLIELFVGRFTVWREGLALLNEKALTGIGLGAWYQQMGGESMHAHSDLLQMLCDSGLLGAIAILGVVVIFAILAQRIWRLRETNTWSVLGISMAVMMVAFAANGIYETSITGVIVVPGPEQLAVPYHYVAVPVIWALLGLFYVACARMTSISCE